MSCRRIAGVVAAASLAACAPAEIDPGAPATDQALQCASPSEEIPQPPPGVALLPGTPWALARTAPPRSFPSAYYPVKPRIKTSTIDAAAPTVIYLNRVGATLSANYDDASRDESSVVAGQNLPSATIPAGPFSDAEWASVLSCVKDEFSRFNVQIVDQRPSGSGYFMAMFGGTAAALNLPSNVGGIAPIDPNACQTIPSAVVYIFSGAFGSNPQLNCEIAAQEISHAFSLDHEYLASDPMTYLQYSGHKTFQDQAASCGEYQTRACICNRPSQDSVQVLMQHLGPAGATTGGDTTPPQVAITSPSDGAQMPEGQVQVVVHATDDTQVARVTLHYTDGNGQVSSTCGDNALPCTQSGADYTFTIPSAKGAATMSADAVDSSNNMNMSGVVHLTLTAPNGNPGPTNGAIAIALDMATDQWNASRIVVPTATITTTKGSVNGATLVWTDGAGKVTRFPMCPAGTNQWRLALQLSLQTGGRSFSVEATDTAGDRGDSTVATFSVDN